MYYVIGRDEREYGPADAESVRQWILERRINADSRARTDEAAEWKPLGEFGEFTDALREAATAPNRPFSPPGPTADSIAAEFIARQPRVDVSGCISKAFDLVMNDFGLMVGATLLVGLIMMVPLIGWVLSGPLLGGLTILILRRIRGVPATVSDAFIGFGPQFWQLFLVKLVASLLISLGWLLCLLPGIYLAVAWVFALVLVADRGLDFWTAMEVSRQVVTKCWWTMFGLVLISYLIMAAGFLACIVGLIVTIPIGMAAILYAYEDIFGAGPAALAPLPIEPAPTPNA